jgi:hypothetical protein
LSPTFSPSQPPRQRVRITHREVPLEFGGLERQATHKICHGARPIISTLSSGIISQPPSPRLIRTTSSQHQPATSNHQHPTSGRLVIQTGHLKTRAINSPIIPASLAKVRTATLPFPCIPLSPFSAKTEIADLPESHRARLSKSTIARLLLSEYQRPTTARPLSASYIFSCLSRCLHTVGPSSRQRSAS